MNNLHNGVNFANTPSTIYGVHTTHLLQAIWDGHKFCLLRYDELPTPKGTHEQD